MKKTVFISLLLLYQITLYSQDSKTSKSKTGNYIIDRVFQTNTFITYDDKEKSRKVIHLPNRKVNIVSYNETTKKYLIQYWKWLDNGAESGGSLLNDIFYRNTTLENGAQTTELIYFEIHEDLFDENFTKYYKRWLPITAGFYSIPFKIRIKNFDFEQDLNVGLSIGFPFRVNRRLEKRWIFEPHFGLGITKINLTAKNTGGTVTDVRTANALTLSGGLLFRFTEKINIGVFGGYDFLGQNDIDTQWIYNKKFWLGFGINIAFNIKKPEKEEPIGNN